MQTEAALQTFLQRQGAHCPTGSLLAETSAEAETLWTALVADSRLIETANASHTIFVALAGAHHHGVDFLPEVVALGVRCVITDEAGWQRLQQQAPAMVKQTVVWVVPEAWDLRAQAQLADWFYRHPSQQLQLLGVTGTNGKTSVAHLSAQLLQAQGWAVGVMGTLGVGLWQQGQWQGQSSANTTPEPFMLHQQLAAWVQEGVQVAVMEVSSHAIALGRIAALQFHALALTQVTRDHLDFHGSLATYQAVKQALFLDWPAQYWVLNAQDKIGLSLAAPQAATAIRLQPLTQLTLYSADCQALSQCLEAHPVTQTASQVHRLCFEQCQPTAEGWWLQWQETAHHRQQANLPLLGRFQLENLLAAWGLVQSVGGAVTAQALTQLQPLPGRMQWIRPPAYAQGEVSAEPEGPRVLVDYAHTPDALSTVLSDLKRHWPQQKTATPPKLWLVMGCGGDRDQGKRAQMGAVAAQWADEVILTNDNPRGEAPMQIVQSILQGMSPSRQQQTQVCLDRPAAIAAALTQAQPKDWVLVAGKGHETTQTIEGRVLPMSDIEIVKKLLQAPLQTTTQ